MNIFKVGQHRGNSRVWFQGGKLVEAGFTVGLPYTVTETETQLVLALSPFNDQQPIKGTRKVSKKPSKNGPIPVIDLNSKKTSTFFKDDVSCSVEFGTNWIIITRITGAVA